MGVLRVKLRAPKGSGKLLDSKSWTMDIPKAKKTDEDGICRQIYEKRFQHRFWFCYPKMC